MQTLLTSDNIQTVVTVLTFVGSLTAWLVERFVRRRRRLSYRVHWDHSVNVTPRVAISMGLAVVRMGDEVPQPSVALLRVENIGGFDISAAAVREPLEYSFGGRRIVHFEIQESDPPTLVDEIYQPAEGPGPQIVTAKGPTGETPSGALLLPRFEIERKGAFKLLVLLSGPGKGVTVRGKIAGGDIIRESRRRPRSRSSLLLGGLTLALGGLAVGLLWTGTGRPTESADCPADGSLSVTGSTAFAPVMEQLAGQYVALCPGASIQVDAAGTNPAIQVLITGGTADAELGSTESARIKLVMADDYPGLPVRDARLGYWPVGIAPFAVVINDTVGLSALRTAQLQRLFAGELQRWDDPTLGGASGDVVLVSRKVGSGTRDTFNRRVLGQTATAAVSSTDCLTKDIPGRQADVRHCERDSTADVLDTVARTPGAIGYASVPDAAAWVGKGLLVVSVDGYTPTRENIATGRYKFWAVERLYRWGKLVPPSLRDRFVQYILDRPEASRTLTDSGFFRCTDPLFTDGEVATACLPQLDTATPTATPSPTS